MSTTTQLVFVYAWFLAPAKNGRRRTIGQTAIDNIEHIENWK